MSLGGSPRVWERRQRALALIRRMSSPPLTPLCRGGGNRLELICAYQRGNGAPARLSSGDQPYTARRGRTYKLRGGGVGGWNSCSALPARATIPPKLPCLAVLLLSPRHSSRSSATQVFRVGAAAVFFFQEREISLNPFHPVLCQILFPSTALAIPSPFESQGF